MKFAMPGKSWRIVLVGVSVALLCSFKPVSAEETVDIAVTIPGIEGEGVTPACLGPTGQYGRSESITERPYQSALTFLVARGSTSLICRW